MTDSDEAQQTAVPGTDDYSNRHRTSGPPETSYGDRRTVSKTRNRSLSKARAADNGDSYITRLLDALQVFDLFAASAAGVQKLESLPDSEALKRDKRTLPTQPLPQVSSQDRYDYEKKHLADEPQKGLDPNARVWRVYLDEAGQFDLDMVENIRDTVDVILVFAGLFSAIVSTLVSQASTAFQLDYAQVAAALLMELIAVQRAVATGLSLADAIPSSLNIHSPQSSTGSAPDRWISGLWFTSLAFSLTTALIAVLIKQWLQAHIAPIFQGSPKDHGRIRHFRYLGMEEWHFPPLSDYFPHSSTFPFSYFSSALLCFSSPWTTPLEPSLHVSPSLHFQCTSSPISRHYTTHSAFIRPPCPTTPQG
ncbi:hypothetical protein BDV98DRAFT_588344 [Pterulicium gracile]|uniref:DUF6535 domain-containing protein n=1 Tax=Pterulicium gracile TaxID=1884261 RepID=A0A5C3R4U8_9AGAR|nr:hypothetical protein BDV98DRAFT_588344 [Pterula gracilis]